MKIVAIHATLNAVEPLCAAFRALDPELQLLNLVHEELLARANAVGGVDAQGLRSFLRVASLAADARPDGIVIACSVFSPYAAEVEALAGVPAVAVDQPMLEQALRLGGKIGLLATTAASNPAAVEKLQKLAAGRPFDYACATVTEALRALKAGDAARHNALLREAAQGLTEQGCTSLLLTQITMACAADSLRDLPAVVLTSPETGAAALLRRIRQRQA